MSDGTATYYCARCNQTFHTDAATVKQEREAHFATHRSDADKLTTVSLNHDERLTLACALMSGTPGEWAHPPIELLDRLLGERLATCVLEFRFSPDTLRAIAEAAARSDRTDNRRNA